MNLLFSIVPVAYADVDTLVKRVNKFVINPILVLLFAAALMYFLYGLFEFLSNTGSEEKRTIGKEHMLWGIIGMFIMMSVFAIMQIIMNTLGVTGIDPRGGGVTLPD